MTANEKLKSLYGDLERYKKSITEEMHRLAKDIAAAAERQMAEIGEISSRCTAMADLRAKHLLFLSQAFAAGD